MKQNILVVQSVGPLIINKNMVLRSDMSCNRPGRNCFHENLVVTMEFEPIMIGDVTTLSWISLWVGMRGSHVRIGQV